MDAIIYYGVMIAIPVCILLILVAIITLVIKNIWKK